MELELITVGSSVYIKDDSKYNHQGIDDNGHKMIGKVIKYKSKLLPGTSLSTFNHTFYYEVEWSDGKEYLYTPLDIEEKLINADKELEKIKEQFKPLITKKKTMKNQANTESSFKDKFVFMDKAASILEIGLMTGKNVILYGPGE